MNEKGFTLVEILSVIFLLSIIIVIAGTTGFKTFENTKTVISKENEKTIIEGAKVLLIELENCNKSMDDTLKKFMTEKRLTCKSIMDGTSENPIEVSLEYLINNKYVDSEGINDISKNNPDYSIKIYLDGTNKIEVN